MRHELPDHGELAVGDLVAQARLHRLEAREAEGAVEVGRRVPDGVMAVFPSDHHVQDAATLRSVVAGAAAAAKATNAFVTIGVEPTRAETGFGYLEVGPKMGEWGGHAFLNVSRFREKPSVDLAEEFVESGNYLWNAGMFVFTVGALKDAFRKFLPRTLEALERLAQNPAALEEEWGNMDATSIDYGVMERSSAILTVRCSLGWRDLGTWSSAGEMAMLFVAEEIGRNPPLELGRRDSGTIWHKGGE